jgi:hypothetical protein
MPSRPDPHAMARAIEALLFSPQTGRAVADVLIDKETARLQHAAPRAPGPDHERVKTASHPDRLAP